MKKLILALILVGSLNLGRATDYTYNFNPTGLPATLDGSYYYEWGISWSLPTGQSIVDATLTYDNIKLTIAGINPPDYLYSTLLASAPKGVTSYYDGDDNVLHPSGTGVFALGKAPFNSVGSSYSSLQYDFAGISGALAALDADVAGGQFGIGIDPHCHYSYSSITLDIVTTDNGHPHGLVPDAAATAMLLGMALVGLGIYRRK